MINVIKEKGVINGSVEKMFNFAKFFKSQARIARKEVENKFPEYAKWIKKEREQLFCAFCSLHSNEFEIYCLEEFLEFLRDNEGAKYLAKYLKLYEDVRNKNKTN